MARKFTATTVFAAQDKTSKTLNNIDKATKRAMKTVNRESKIAGTGFKRFSNSVVMGSKRALVSMNQMGASVGRSVKRMTDKLISFKNAAIFAGIALVVGNTIDVFASFEQANANLASVMATATQPQLKALQIDSKRLGATTAKTSTEVVGLQESFARLGFGADDIINMTEATISGSVAMQGELSETADLVGAMIKSFDNFESANAPEVIDKLTASTQASALNFEKLQTALPIVAGAANAAKVPFTKLLASLGKLSDAGIDASSSASALRNIMLVAAKKGVPYEKLLSQVANSTDRLKVANDLFGKRGAVVAVTLAKQMSSVDELDKSLQNVAGTAGVTAAKQLDTLKGSLTILGSAWEGFILSMEDGTGAFSGFLTNTVKVITEVLSLASGTAKAKTELTAAELKIRNIASSVIVLGKAIGAVIAAFVAFKVATAALRLATTIYNVVLGIQTALLNRNVFALRKNMLALKTMSITTKIVTGVTKAWAVAQKILNIAMKANPIGLIITGIMLLVTGIIYLIRNFDKLKMAVTNTFNIFEKNPILKFLLFPIYMLVLGLKLLIDNFDLIKQVAIGVFESIKNAIMSVWNWFKAIGNFISAVFTLAFNIVSKKITNLFDKFRQFGNKIKAPFIPLIEFFQKMGDAIKVAIVDKFKQIGEFVGNIIDKITKFFKGSTAKINARTEQIVKINQEQFGNKEVEKTTKTSDNTTKTIEQTNLIKESDLVKETSETKTIKTEFTGVGNNDKMITALDDNTKAVTDSASTDKNWSGKFQTSILKDANISEVGQKEIATKALSKETNNIIYQKELLKKSTFSNTTTTNNSVVNGVTTQSNTQRKEKPTSGTITVNVVDRTSGKFGLDVESTGIEVITTGN